MLLAQYACRECIFVVVRQHWHCRLDYDRSPIEFERNEVDCASMNPHACREGLAMGVQAGKGGQQ